MNVQWQVTSALGYQTPVAYAQTLTAARIDMKTNGTQMAAG